MTVVRLSLVVLLLFLFAGPATAAEEVLTDSAMDRADALFKAQEPLIPKAISARQVLVDVTYYGFDGKLHAGQLVVHRSLVRDIREIFTAVRKAKFPIHSAIPVSGAGMGWSDASSMRINNTSAFNYRAMAGSSRMSLHAYGCAIDINPVQNPYLKGTICQPPGGSYEVNKPGTLTAESIVVKEFLKRGWRWGGNWTTLKDYQHFEKQLPSF